MEMKKKTTQYKHLIDNLRAEAMEILVKDFALSMGFDNNDLKRGDVDLWIVDSAPDTMMTIRPDLRNNHIYLIVFRTDIDEVADGMEFAKINDVWQEVPTPWDKVEEKDN